MAALCRLDSILVKLAPSPPARGGSGAGAGAGALCIRPVSRLNYLPHLASLTRTCAAATKADVENHFNTHGTGEITEIKLMNGFGFIEYKDAMDARDVVPGKYRSTLLV